MYKKFHVLVIEDHDDSRAMFAINLRAVGVTVHEASDAVEALEKLGGGLIPDLVFLDLRLPDVRGETLYCTLKNFPACAKTKIVIMSANNRVEEKATELGADGWLQKPVGRMEIQTEVLKQLKHLFISAL